jgi:hypothetical protein
MRIDGIVPQRAGPYGSSPMSAVSARHWSLVRRGTEEWDHDEEAGAIGEQTAPVPASIHAAGVEYLADRIVSLADDVEVDQVDRRPRREQIQQQREKIPEAIDEIVRGDQRQSGRRERGDRQTRDALARRAAQWLERVGDAQQRQ